MNREVLNEIYKKLDFVMQKIVAQLKNVFDGFEYSCGYYNGHYNKGADGEYVMDYFPIPVITINDLCDIEIDLDKISVSTKLGRETALSYVYEKLSGYDFESYGVDEYLDDFYVAGNTYSELVENIGKSNEKEIGFSFLFSEDVDAEEICEAVRFLRKEGFYY